MSHFVWCGVRALIDMKEGLQTGADELELIPLLSVIFVGGACDPSSKLTARVNLP